MRKYIIQILPDHRVTGFNRQRAGGKTGAVDGDIVRGGFKGRGNQKNQAGEQSETP